MNPPRRYCRRLIARVIAGAAPVLERTAPDFRRGRRAWLGAQGY